MYLDFIFNGHSSGDVGDRLLSANMDHHVLRPWVGKDGRSYITVNQGGKLVNMITNAPATLTKDQWILLDETIIRVARPQLRIWGDLQAQGLTYNVPNGMGTILLQQQTMTDFGDATLSMDGLRQGMRDRPHFDSVYTPLPIAHGDFSFSLREIMVARSSQAPLDMTAAEQTTRKVTELVEKLTLGTLSSYSYGGGTIYGLTNHPDRVTVSFTLPTAGGWSPQLFIGELLGAMQSMSDVFFNGPYGAYYSPAWGKYLNDDYSQAYGGKTLRQRVMDTEGLSFFRKADYLTGYQIVIYQLSSDVIRAVTGMKMTTLQWDSHGGLQKNFKVMCIMIPQIRANANGDTGVLHAVAA